ncbi:MAG TPA: hypothetical protein VM324_02055 [Egibacteraceae bacterium]|jgi:hypothetical protein|nr:hypothetical protein [Egibacteraceae bacterium]
MAKRLLGVIITALLLCVGALPALAVEPDDEEMEVEHEELPSYEEIGSGSEISQEFRPEPYEQPTVFAGMLYPLLFIAGVAVLVVLGLYLLWQPRFAQEREAKKRR